MASKYADLRFGFILGTFFRRNKRAREDRRFAVFLGPCTYPPTEKCVASN
ncbi:MAG: hypothetical protein LUC43_06650 [Burkholderiales bacterium]|nr:hypothetical protein [Burkholderiales bacterium]